MAHSFVGTNNLNLLSPVGNFGTRYYSGKDHAPPQFLQTELPSYSSLLFN